MSSTRSSSDIDTSPLKPIIAVVGPTASGKSSLGIELALKFNGEIINCDSVQVYREIQIATAKLSIEERRGVPHHLIDFVSPDINYTAGQWARAAIDTIADIESRGRWPLLVGGTGLYLRALRQPFFPSPPTDENLRRRITRIREQHGAEHLYRLLERLDHESARKLYPRDWPASNARWRYGCKPAGQSQRKSICGPIRRKAPAG